MKSVNKIISYILILCLTLPGMASAQSQGESPSVGDVIGKIMAGDNSYKSYLHVAETEGAGCATCANKTQARTQPMSKTAFYDGWKLNCLTLSSSQLCHDIAKDDKLLCNEPPKTPWYSNIWEKTKACGAGIKKSWMDFFHFMGQVGSYLINKDGAFTKTNAKISKAWTSMTNYMAMEVTKYQDKYHVSGSKAFLAVTANMMKKFTDSLSAMIIQLAPKVGCYNYKAKTRIICQVLAEFFADPILMFQFLKLGPKVLKGTRIAQFFKFHKAKAVKEIVEVTGKVGSKTKKLVAGSDATLMKIDFISKDSKVLIKLAENPNLNNAIASNRKLFEEIFPDKKSLEQLDTYLSASTKQEADDLAEVLEILSKDKKKMSPEQYKDFIDDIQQSIKKSCEL
jgi:hypothetical protein